MCLIRPVMGFFSICMGKDLLEIARWIRRRKTENGVNDATERDASDLRDRFGLKWSTESLREVWVDLPPRFTREDGDWRRL